MPVIFQSPIFDEERQKAFDPCRQFEIVKN
jgi:hypothetical protein